MTYGKLHSRLIGLTNKFEGPKFNIEEVDPSDLRKSRLESKIQKYQTVTDSAKSQVFPPGSELVIFIAFVLNAALNMEAATISKNTESM